MPSLSRRRSILLSLLPAVALVGSCQASPGATGAAPSHVRYSVKKSASAPGSGSNPHIVVEVSLQATGSKVESHILVVYDTKWVTLNLGESQESARGIEINEEGDEPLPSEVGLFSGTILAVRCREQKDDRIETDFRIYRVRSGRVVNKERSKDSLPDGETKELALSW